MATRRTAVDLRQPADLEVAVRIGKAWSDLRRGASMSLLRDYFFGTEEDRLDSGQMDTLDALVRKSSWRMSDLAEALRVDPSTATRAVQRLVKVNLAERNADSGDGRVVVVNATDAGRAVHRDVDRRRGYVISQLMSAFTVAERAVLADLMSRFVRELDDVVKALPRPQPPPCD
ncbi:MAG TPA: MarR family transcriptional regulator [Ilumatobacteraceae bacterium]|jgi:DNA-binding MarR family transcriptional regulator